MGLQSILACISAVCSGGARWWAATSRRWEPPKLFTKLFAKILRPLGMMPLHQEDTHDYVEARSLTSINYIASNPPQYPKKPTEGKQDPLTLYISRVPGTRDIILSTLKPQAKSVTAEDVASSLYYVHLDALEDDPLLPPDQSRHSPSPRSSDDSPRSMIPRKPLPSSSNPALVSAGNPAAPPPPQNQDHGAPVQKPTPVQPTTTLSRASSVRSIRRKPVGPKLTTANPMERNLPSIPQGDEHAVNDEQPPPLPPRHKDHGHAVQHEESSWLSRRKPFTPFSLTLIRRDPTSGNQWNVGKIASYQLENPELIDDKHHQPSPSINIQIETSGYNKFRGMPTRQSLDMMRPSLDIRPGSSSSASRLHVPDVQTQTPVSGLFERQVVMSYSPSLVANIRDKFQRKTSVGDDRSVSPSRRAFHDRSTSQTSIGSFGGDYDGTHPAVITHPAPGLKPRGYVFTSPWDGRCEFVTGHGGRSLKCRHSLPNYGGGVFNPLVDGPEKEHGDDKAKKQPISELRFNLPSSELFTEKKITDEGGARARDQLHDQFNKMLARAHGLEDSDDGEFHLDLSLGREKAGGGNRGKRAKMGKLIIYDEGLKMLDLAVAANVGIWWITWERTYDL
ncbi:hypothetical protein F4775DRAFT_579242 [Biscogniauxia sp. FL1348]|nr:hypothetical protein F4775DRAFT_579242 [Biscogniauxia sp. FL1348]